MSQFEHVSVLISILLALGLAEILHGIHRLIQERERVRFHWLPLVWTVLIFIGICQWWWSSYEQSGRTEWNFFYFLFLLASPIVLYLQAAFVLPEVEPGEPCDLFG